MPVLYSSYPSSMIWSAYEYGQLPSKDFSEVGYRMQAFGQYFSDLYSRKMVEPDQFKKAVGSLKIRLVDEWD